MPGGMVVREEPRRETTSSCCCQKNNQPIFPKDQKITNHDDSLLSDTTFLRKIAIHLVQDIPQMTKHQVTVDTKRIYLSGHGNGCWMAHAMAAYHSDMVAAVACMAGMTLTAIEPQMDTRNPYEPVPSWTIVGALDEIVPPSGVLKSSNDHGSDVWKFPSPQTGFEYLTKLHGCQEIINHATMIPEMDIPDYPLAGALYVQIAQRCSTNNAVVQHLTLATAGHDVYQQQRRDHKQYTSTITTTTMSSYEAETTIDTTQLAWEFVSSFQRNHEPKLLSSMREKKDKDSSIQKTISNHESDEFENPLWMMAIPTSTTTIMASPHEIKSNNNHVIESESKDTIRHVNIEELDGDTHKGNESKHNYDMSLEQHQVDLDDDMILFPSQDNNQNDSNLHTNQKSVTRKSLRGKIVSRFD
jgi:poly(3-hydroxybutyrate) depolymerase